MVIRVFRVMTQCILVSGCYGASEILAIADETARHCVLKTTTVVSVILPSLRSGAVLHIFERSSVS